MSPTDLWPPLELVEAALDGNHILAEAVQMPQLPVVGDALGARTTKTDKELQAAYLLLPLTELAQRRAAVQARVFSSEWAPGRLVQITINGSIVGVLLDRLVRGSQWTGWFAACESNWASEFDVLLEPMDEPFEPMFGVIQVWNPVTVDFASTIQARVVGEISATRLAAVRAVAMECAAGLMISTPAEPGRIGLRITGGAFSVLTGTPLGPHDVRLNYQNAYRTATARLIAEQLTLRVSYVKQKVAHKKNFWSRVKEWFAADWMIRPAFAMIALVVVAQNTGLFSTVSEDGIRFRSPPAAPATGEIRVLWRLGVRMEDVQSLLRSTSTEIVNGPDAEGFYILKSNDAAATKTKLLESALIAQVLTP